MVITSWPARTSLGIRNVPMCPLPPMTTMRITSGYAAPATRAFRSDRSAAHAIPQVKYPVALDDRVRIRQQVLRGDRPEVALAGPEHDVHAHLVDQARGKGLAADGCDLDDAVPRKLLRRG